LLNGKRNQWSNSVPHRDGIGEQRTGSGTRCIGTVLDLGYAASLCHCQADKQEEEEEEASKCAGKAILNISALKRIRYARGVFNWFSVLVIVAGGTEVPSLVADYSILPGRCM
jgi:hypothetical protein